MMVHTITVPRLNANDDEVLMAEISVAVGDHVSADQVLFVVETSKANVDIVAEQAGFVRHIAAQEGQMVPVGAILCLITDKVDEPIPEGEFFTAEKVEEDGPPVEGEKVTAKQRLLRKRQAKYTPLTAHADHDAASEPAPVETGEIPWVQAMRAVVEESCGENAALPEKVFDSVTVEGREYPYASEGVLIQEGVKWGEGVRIHARRLYIARDVQLGDDVYLKADTVYIGSHTRINRGTSLVSGEILIEDGVLFADGVTADLSGGVTESSRLIVGAASLICAGVYLNTSSEILIERESAVSPGAMLFTHSFWQSVLDGYSAMFKPVRVNENAWIGAGCQVLPGVTVGSGSVVLSNSTVVNNVPPHCLVGGVPAKVMRKGIRKSFSQGEKTKIIRDLMVEFAGYLRFKNCQVEMSPECDLIRVAMPDSVVRSIIIITSENMVELEDDENAIYLTYGVGIDAKSGQSVFDMEKRCFTGAEDRLTHELRNYLRRRGIRFLPYAWDSDYRKGL
jgi:acetyltransferase-like isoleucine patch superfamily enzyme